MSSYKRLEGMLNSLPGSEEPQDKGAVNREVDPQGDTASARVSLGLPRL